MNASLRARLASDLPPIYDRLLAKAYGMVHRSGWRRRFDQDRKGAAEDLVHDAVLRLPSWNPENVDLYGFLAGAMRSIVNNATKHSDNRLMELDVPPSGASSPLSETLEDPRATPEEALGVIQGEQARENDLVEAAEDDPVLLKYVEALMDGVGGPAEIAKYMNVPSTTVYQTHRKLCRRMAARKQVVR